MPEEDELLSSEKWKPAGIFCDDHRKVKDIDHSSLQEGGVAPFRRKQLGYFVGLAIEHHAIKGSVDQITGGPGKYECEAENESCGNLFLPEFCEVPPQAKDGRKAKDAEQVFAEAIAEFNAKGHPVVFDEMEDEPVFKNDNLFTHPEVGLDIDFECLIGNQYQ